MWCWCGKRLPSCDMAEWHWDHKTSKHQSDGGERDIVFSEEVVPLILVCFPRALGHITFS